MSNAIATSTSTAKLERVMHVDDECDILAVTKLALESIGGYSVCCCETGRQGLDQLAAFSPQIVIVDHMMPEMNGAEFLVALRRIPEGADIPVVFMTARAPKTVVESLKSLGALGILPKPFDPFELPRQIEKLWVGHVSHESSKTGCGPIGPSQIIRRKSSQKD